MIKGNKHKISSGTIPSSQEKQSNFGNFHDFHDFYNDCPLHQGTSNISLIVFQIIVAKYMTNIIFDFLVLVKTLLEII